MPLPDADGAEAERIVTSARLHATHTIMLIELIELLIKNGVLERAQVVAAYERLSGEMMKKEGAAFAVQTANLIRDRAAGEDRKQPHAKGDNQCAELPTALAQHP